MEELVVVSAGRPTSPEWLLMTYRIPLESKSFYVRTWRILSRMPVLKLTPGLVAHPHDPEAEVTLRELADSINAVARASAHLWRAVPDRAEDLVAQFNAARDQEYAGVIAAASAVLASPVCDTGLSHAQQSELLKIVHRFEKIAASDTLGAAMRAQAHRTIADCRAALASPRSRLKIARAG